MVTEGIPLQKVALQPITFASIKAAQDNYQGGLALLAHLKIYFVLFLLFPTLAYSQNEILQKTKVELSFQSSVYSPTGNNDLSSGTPTIIDFTCDEGATGLADQAAANSDQVDLGSTRSTLFTVIANLEWFAAVTAGNTVDFYWSASGNSAVAAGNPGEPDGVDGLYSPTGFTDDEGVKQMIYIGSHINNGNASTQISYIGSFTPPAQFGQLVMFNDSGTLLCGTDDIESSVLMTGIIDEIQ